MKIERISDTQIRCTLNKHDLIERQLKISELAYGSEKAKALFRDMMEQANIDFGFDVDDIPLMIEAIPTSRDSLVLVITKVESPEDFDEHFSRFGLQDGRCATDTIDADYDDSEVEDSDSLSSEDIVNCFEQLHELISEGLRSQDGDSSEGNSTGFIPLSEALRAGKKAKKANQKKKPEDICEKIRLFSFISLDPIIYAAHLVPDAYTGKNSVWKNANSGKYYLLLNRGNAKNAFRSACSLISEFGKEEQITYATQDYFNEHYQIIIKDRALAQLAEL